MSELLSLDDRPFAYLLDADKVPYPVTMEAYMASMKELGSRDWRRVARTRLPDGREVSTVFLTMDHAWGGGPPLLFETMVFPDSELCERYSTWQEAEEGHRAIVARIEAGVPVSTEEEG